MIVGNEIGQLPGLVSLQYYKPDDATINGLYYAGSWVVTVVWVAIGVYMVIAGHRVMRRLIVLAVLAMMVFLVVPTIESIAYIGTHHYFHLDFGVVQSITWPITMVIAACLVILTSTHGKWKSLRLWSIILIIASMVIFCLGSIEMAMNLWNVLPTDSLQKDIWQIVRFSAGVLLSYGAFLCGWLVYVASIDRRDSVSLMG